MTTQPPNSKAPSPEEQQDHATIGTDLQFSVPREAYSDFRPTVKNIAALTEAVTRPLRLPQLLADSLEKSIKWIFHRANEICEAIPTARQQEPSIRLIGHLIESAKWVEDEPELKELFAQLLANACDTDMSDAVRPTFADIIARMEPLDAKVLRALARVRREQELGDLRAALWPDEARHHALITELSDTSREQNRALEVALGNLVGIGLVAEDQRPSWAEMSNLKHRFQQDLDNVRIRAAAETVAEMTGRREYGTRFSLTALGWAFAASALPAESVASEPSPSGVFSTVED